MVIYPQDILCGVIDNASQREIGEANSNSTRVPYVHLCANKLAKNMNLSLHSQLCVKQQGKLGSLAFVDNQSIRERNDNLLGETFLPNQS